MSKATEGGTAAVEVLPRAIRYEVLLTASTAISHHDPAATDDSNTSLFNRQKQLLPVARAEYLPQQWEADALAESLPVPAACAAILADLSFVEFLGCALVKRWLDLYNSQDGVGVFSGMARYARLETRLRHAAVGARGLRSWWDRLCGDLQVGIHAGAEDAGLLELLTLPKALQTQILAAYVKDYRSIVALARHWHAVAKGDWTQGKERPAVETRTLAFDAGEIAPGAQGSAVFEVPAVSGNSLRHQLVRGPAWLCLAAALGIGEATPGQGLVPPGVEAIFVNGGNIAAGAKQPNDPFTLAWRIRDRYPSLDLLGGVTDSFDLGESRLSVASWLVCRENREALKGSPAYDLPAAGVSAFDLVDDVTLTRQAGRTGQGQMIFSQETLAAGTQVLCRLILSPFAPLLTRGALASALERYQEDGETIGGQSARGFGHCRVETVWGDPGAAPVAESDAYDAYLAENREGLLAGLVDGTLGTGTVVLT